MGTDRYRKTYRAALDQANADLERIFEEFERLQLHKENIERLLVALDPFLAAAPVSRPAPLRMEPSFEISEPARGLVAMSTPVIAKVSTPEPAVPGTFDPNPDVIQDPLQHRINRALGLAVA